MSVLRAKFHLLIPPRWLPGVLLCCLLVPTVAAQPGRGREPLAAQQVQAVYLLHLARFVKWPEHAFPHERSPFIIGVAGNDAVLASLRRVARAETVSDRPIECREVRTAAELARCHLVFVSSEAVPAMATRFPELAEHPILLVSNAEGFLVLGGHVQFVARSGRMKLRIAPQQLRESQLHASSQLLRVAEPVR